MGKQLKEGQYNVIREALLSGISVAKISKLSGFSGSMIYKVKRNNSWEDYREETQAALSLAKKPTAPTDVPILDMNVDQEDRDVISQLDAALKLIGDAMNQLRERTEPKVAPWYKKLKAGK